MEELCVDFAVYYRVWWVCLPRYVYTLLFIIESGGLFTTLCVDSAVYYRVRWVVYHAMCRLCSLRV